MKSTAWNGPSFYRLARRFPGCIGLFLSAILFLGVPTLAGAQSSETGGENGEESRSPAYAAIQTKIFPQNYRLMYRGEELPETGRRGQAGTIRLHRLPQGLIDALPEVRGRGESRGLEELLRVEAPGYYPRELTELPPEGEILELKLERRDSRLRKLGQAETGKQPKSVVFTADGEYLITPLLGGKGAQVFQQDPLEPVMVLEPPLPYAAESGYVESLHLPDRGEIWFSQMDTASVHIFSDGTAGFTYLESIDMTGTWSKVLTRSSSGDAVYASHWSTGNISEIDPETREERRLLTVGGIPRGMTPTADGGGLYVFHFDSGLVSCLDTDTGEVRGQFGKGLPGAARHGVLDRRRQRLYVSDMARGTVKVFHGRSGDLIAEIPVGPKLNTLDLSRDGAYLFVSSRGVNSRGPRGYLQKGPNFGKVSVIDCRRLEVVDWVWGGNQPTGLALSPDNRTLAFTNFLDDTLELYDVSRFWEEWSGRNIPRETVR